MSPQRRLQVLEVPHYLHRVKRLIQGDEARTGRIIKDVSRAQALEGGLCSIIAAVHLAALAPLEH